MKGKSICSIKHKWEQMTPNSHRCNFSPVTGHNNFFKSDKKFFCLTIDNIDTTNEGDSSHWIIDVHIHRKGGGMHGWSDKGYLIAPQVYTKLLGGWQKILVSRFLLFSSKWRYFSPKVLHIQFDISFTSKHTHTINRWFIIHTHKCTHVYTPLHPKYYPGLLYGTYLTVIPHQWTRICREAVCQMLGSV